MLVSYSLAITSKGSIHAIVRTISKHPERSIYEGNGPSRAYGIEFAANGLSEINKFEQKQEVESSACFSIYNANKKEKKEHPSMSVYTSERSHFLTIREEDMDRLEHGEYLNDTLVDFWMQW